MQFDTNEPAVALPIVNPPRVMVNADALMAAPEIVIMLAVEDVALQVAAKFETLLKPAATVGVTFGAKKLEGNVRVMVLPDEMGREGVKTRVMGTDAFPVTRSEMATLKFESDMLHAKEVAQRLQATIHRYFQSLPCLTSQTPLLLYFCCIDLTAKMVAEN